ncbi:MAG: hypothetical protein Q8Q88_07285 [Phenylobacterium sp.]|uniref:hypothetical protein n=1 Tax=Phenylobacterium sp. TaxID=1871053 RepID=UPI002732A27B|nr:hypothetical protein [Phenylobacterium sp.]MDP3746839.1 hypothetical protein [Phenylobacterium sp.]
MKRRPGIGIIVAAMVAAGAAQAQVTPADRAGAFKAAGVKSGKWVDRESGAECQYSIEADGVKDLNGDGRPDIVITGSGTYCYGNTGQGYFITEKTAAGTWRLIDQNQGIPTFLPTRGAGGWPDIEVGGPGFCFPIVRYNGKAYAFLRNKEYQRGACARR